jgi:hypothetical protein
MPRLWICVGLASVGLGLAACSLRRPSLPMRRRRHRRRVRARLPRLRQGTPCFDGREIQRLGREWKEGIHGPQPTTHRRPCDRSRVGLGHIGRPRRLGAFPRGGRCLRESSKRGSKRLPSRTIESVRCDGGWRGRHERRSQGPIRLVYPVLFLAHAELGSVPNDARAGPETGRSPNLSSRLADRGERS